MNVPTQFSAITVLTVILIAFGLGIALALVWLRRRAQQTRLDEAFQRARKVKRSGSGIQGTPYDVYGFDTESNGSWRKH